MPRDTARGMSRENVQLVLGTFRAFADRDEQALFAAYSPEVEWDLRRYSPWTDRQLFPGAPRDSRVLPPVAGGLRGVRDRGARSARRRRAGRDHRRRPRQGPAQRSAERARPRPGVDDRERARRAHRDPRRPRRRARGRGAGRIAATHDRYPPMYDISTFGAASSSTAPGPARSAE